MAHHAYLGTGAIDAGIEDALAFGERELGLIRSANPDVIVLRYGQFPVEEARRVTELVFQSALSGKKLIIIAAERIFHEAQNALLKTFEEPPEGTTIVLVVPSEGQVLATMRSRLQPLPQTQREQTLHPCVTATDAERKKMIEKLLVRAKADKDDEKQAARAEAIRMVEDLTRAAHDAYQKKESEELKLLLSELDRFTPILHERSAPLKLIFEHLLLVLPKHLLR